MHVDRGYTVGSLTAENMSLLSRDQRIMMQIVTLLVHKLPTGRRNRTELLGLLVRCPLLKSRWEDGFGPRSSTYGFRNPEVPEDELEDVRHDHPSSIAASEIDEI